MSRPRTSFITPLDGFFPNSVLNPTHIDPIRELGICGWQMPCTKYRPRSECCGAIFLSKLLHLHRMPKLRSIDDIGPRYLDPIDRIRVRIGLQMADLIERRKTGDHFA